MDVLVAFSFSIPMHVVGVIMPLDGDQNKHSNIYTVLAVYLLPLPRPTRWRRIGELRPCEGKERMSDAATRVSYQLTKDYPTTFEVGDRWPVHQSNNEDTGVDFYIK
jgi:hypothetical protein